MKNVNYKNIFIIVLILILAGMIIFRKDIANNLGYSETVVEYLEIEKQVISKQIIDSLALIPPLEEKVDSLEKVLKINKKELKKVEREYTKLTKQIAGNTPDEDLEYYITYLNITTDVPRLTEIDGNRIALIHPKHIKNTNYIFSDNYKLKKQQEVLTREVIALEDIKTIQYNEIQILESTIDLYTERSEINNSIINEKNNQLNLMRKKHRRKMFGTVSVGILAIGATVLILN